MLRPKGTRPVEEQAVEYAWELAAKVVSENSRPDWAVMKSKSFGNGVFYSVTVALSDSKSGPGRITLR